MMLPKVQRAPSFPLPGPTTAAALPAGIAWRKASHGPIVTCPKASKDVRPFVRSCSGRHLVSRALSGEVKAGWVPVGRSVPHLWARQDTADLCMPGQPHCHCAMPDPGRCGFRHTLCSQSAATGTQQACDKSHARIDRSGLMATCAGLAPRMSCIPLALELCSCACCTNPALRCRGSNRRARYKWQHPLAASMHQRPHRDCQALAIVSCESQLSYM